MLAGGCELKQALAAFFVVTLEFSRGTNRSLCIHVAILGNKSIRSKKRQARGFQAVQAADPSRCSKFYQKMRSVR